MSTLAQAKISEAEAKEAAKLPVDCKDERILSGQSRTVFTTFATYFHVTSEPAARAKSDNDLLILACTVFD